ncbi:MAG: tetratricopeptide repeat protein [bacterium]
MRRSLLFLVIAVSQTACVSHWRGEKIEADIVALEGRLDQQVEDLRSLRAGLQEDLGKVAAQLMQTERKLVESIERLQSGNADNMLIIEQLREELNTARGELARIEHQMPGKPTGALPDVGDPAVPAPVGAPALPEDAAELYRYGYERKQAGDCAEAIRAMATFAQKFPDNNRADNSLFLLAECQFEQKEHTASIRTLQTVMNSYSKGDKVDDALVLMHDNFVALGRCKDALPFLETLIAEYPRSNQAKVAQTKLKRTKQGCK